jgi:Uri superfamily endonuclease
LQIDLAEAVMATSARRQSRVLPAGRYLYCGSADGTVTGSWIVPAGRECDLVAMFTSLPTLMPGFGSSDCGCCRSHLLCLPSGMSMADFGFSAHK